MTTARSRAPSALRSVLAFAFRHWMRQRGRTLAIGACMVAGTVTEIFVPVFAGHMIDALARGSAGLDAAWRAFAAMFALGTAMVVLRHLGWMAIIPFTQRNMRDAAAEAFQRVQRLSADWHANSFAGSTVRKVTRGMWAFDQLNDTLLMALLPSLTVLIGTVLLLAARWPLLGLVMLVGALAYIGLTVVLAVRLLAPAARLSNQWDTKLGGALADAIGTNAVVKAFGAEAREDDRIARLLDKWSRRTTRTWIYFTRSGTGQLALLWATRAAATGTGLYLWSVGQASAGDVAYVLTAYLVLHGYLRDIGQHVHQLQRAINDMEDLVELQAAPFGIADRPGAEPIRIERGEIRFEGVGFRYGGHANSLYDRLDVTIRAGERVGLVGHSGSGKSTFVKLLQRLHDVTEGRIAIDGQDISQVQQASLRRQIAIVPQEPVLFHRSLAENIAYARPGASPEEIERAARLAHAHDFIAALPRGYRTMVGERGVKLSGGERQRVALARAFLADAPILVLDEATSSLDSESESLIQDAIERLLVGRTAIVIAHRLSTVRRLDRILVFDGGRIVEDGPHAALLRIDDGIYRRLYERQAGVDREPVIG